LILELEDEEVKEIMAKNTELVNESNPENVEDRFLYQKNLVEVYKKLAKILINELSKNRTSNSSLPLLFFAPLRGGELPEIVMKKEIDDAVEKISIWPFKIRLARIKKKGMLGVKEVFFESQPPDLKKLKKDVIIFDDCIASTVSIEALLDLIKEWSLAQGVSSKELKIWIAAAAATQRGIERLLYLAKEKYGFGNMKIIDGVLVFRMNSDFYLVDAENPTKYIVGDMGDWTEKLPEGFNDEAPWNKFRE